MKKRSVLLIIALVLGAGYLAYSAVYWGGAVSEASGAKGVGAELAAMLVMPHLIVTGIAVLFNLLGVVMNKTGFALTAGILYSVAMILFAAYFMFVVIEAVLCFIAYARMKKASETLPAAS